jgi:hypothetical protein
MDTKEGKPQYVDFYWAPCNHEASMAPISAFVVEATSSFVIIGAL